MKLSRGWVLCLGAAVGLVWASPALAGRPLDQPSGMSQGSGPSNLQQQKKAMRTGGPKKAPQGNPPGWAPASGLRQQTGTQATQQSPGLRKKSSKRGTQQQGQMGQQGMMGGQQGTMGGQQGMMGGQQGTMGGPIGQQGQPLGQQPPSSGAR